MQNVYTLYPENFPILLNEINDPPEKLYVAGRLPSEDTRILCVVGSRRYSRYGEESCKKLIAGLAGYDICIVSGLAHGIDSIAHRAAIINKLQTVAFPGSGLDPKVLYPQKHLRLAEEIIYYGGALVSEFEMTQPSLPWTFPQRNRLMAGMSHATLVIEATEKSGTLITSRLAMEYNRDVGAVPGQINSRLAEGSNNLISDGAKIIRTSNDILEMLGFSIQNSQGNLLEISGKKYDELNALEMKIIRIIQIEPRNKDFIIENLMMSPNIVNIMISKLELEGFLIERDGRINLR